jgi:hypothetical protein
MKKKQAVTPLSDEDCRAIEGMKLFDSHSDPVERDAQGRPLNFYRPLPPGLKKRKGK